MATYPLQTNAILELAFVGQLCGSRILTTFHYKWKGSVEEDGRAEVVKQVDSHMVDEWQDTLTEAYLELAPANYTMQQITGQIIFPVRYVRYTRNVSYPGLGDTSGTANTAGVIVRRTLLAGRDAVGTIHVPMAMNNAVATDGIWNEVILGKMDTFAEAAWKGLAPEMGSFDITWDGVLLKRSNPGGSFLLTSATAKDTCRVMRRRTFRIGE